MNSSVKKLIWVFLFSVSILSGCADMLVNLGYHPRDDSPFLSKQIASTFRDSHHFALKGAYESILNGVLAEFVRNCFYDPSILKALQLSHKEKEGA